MKIIKSLDNKELVSILTTFITLVLLNFARIFCNKYCLQTQWYQTILNDNLHHYQLGIIIILISFFLLRNRQNLKRFLIALGMGMIIDESMYLLPPLGLTNFTHNHIEGTIFEFVVFGIYVLVYYKYKRILKILKNTPTNLFR